ncbi:MAG: hypothetical protein R6U37_02320 [Dehalococcoidia bacterium]
MNEKKLAAGRSDRARCAPPVSRWWLFPLGVLAIYGVVFLLSPDDAGQAFSSSGHVFRSIAWPMAVVFGVMVLLALFVKPSQIVRFLGSGAGKRGFILSVVAGIISMGPIYAWYPLLKELRDKGATNSLLAVFLYNRSIKPALLPVMVGYFGWIYVGVLTVFMIAASAVAGYFTGVLSEEE